MVSILNSRFSVVSYDGEDDGRHPIKNILTPGPQSHCSKKNSNCNLILQCADEFALIHAALKAPDPEMCTSPIKGCLIWVSNELPTVEATAEFDDSLDRSWELTKQRSIEAVRRRQPGGPVAFIETRGDELEGYQNLVKPFPVGRFVHVKFLRGEDPTGIDIGKLWLLGLKGPEARQKAEALAQPIEFPERFNLITTPVKAFQELTGRHKKSLDFVSTAQAQAPTGFPLSDEPHLLVFSRDEPRPELQAALQAAAPQYRAEYGLAVVWIGAMTPRALADFAAEKLGVAQGELAIRLVDYTVGIYHRLVIGLNIIARHPTLQSSPPLSTDSRTGRPVERTVLTAPFPLIFFFHPPDPLTTQRNRKWAAPADMELTDSVELLGEWIADTQSGRAEPFVLSAPALQPGVTVVTGSSFGELVLDPATDVFLGIFADCTLSDSPPNHRAPSSPRSKPCQRVSPLVARLAALIHHPTLRIAKVNIDKNDIPKEYCPEDHIPLLKMFPAGPAPKQVLTYDGDRTRVAMATFIHQHIAGPKFDLEALMPTLREEDAVAEKIDEALHALQATSALLERVGAEEDPHVRAAMDGVEKAIPTGNIDRITEALATLVIDTEPMHAQLKQLVSARSAEVLGDCKRVTAPAEIEMCKVQAEEERKPLVVYYMKETEENLDDMLGIDEFMGGLAAQLPAMFIKADICTPAMEAMATEQRVTVYPTFAFWKEGVEAKRIEMGDPFVIRMAVMELLSRQK
ncbi:hypothetical protein PAPYR_6332 [Paratrimastix pyriformis]|uniref:Thioredoxin domain-containing protein n=1 Tax=Paratrimastix pyriformis TaxID=342808 RepID=A0ABQ8UH04_9EUKA|nr:hypothetical protein PAPYR_6332 [Paratrimastix pyriformis]